MKPRWFVLLLALNAALFALCCLLVIRTSTSLGTPRGSVTDDPQVSTAPPAVAHAEEVVSVPADPPPVILLTNAFHWSQIESADYRTYIANLRGIGCPEATIKDIILTDIMKLFAQTRGQYYHNGRDFRFWETNEKRTLTTKQLEERDRQLAQIDKQAPAVLRELLGLNYDRELNRLFVDTQEDDRRLSFLPDYKRSQVLAVREKIETLKERMFEQAEAGQVDPDGWRQFEQERAELLASVLNPEEVLEYELRTSELSERLRAGLVGFNPSEAEFREIFGLMREHEETLMAAGVASEAARAASDAQLQEQIRARLNPERVDDYEQSQNKEYQELAFFASRYELPSPTARTLLDYKQVAEFERGRVLASTELSDEARQTALQAIQIETEAALRQVLGERTFASFKQGPGAWIGSLGPRASSSAR